MATPNITQVLPQTIPAGSQTMTLKVSGTNFPAKAAILWNGAALSTTIVDANTLSGTIGSSSLSTPGTAQLQVQNTQTMQESQSVPVTIAAASTSAPSSLTISVTSLPQGTVNTPYAAALSSSGGTSPYTWSVTSGQLPTGLSLSANTGAISGTPTSSGNYSFGITVTDSSSPAQSTFASLAVSVTAAPVTPTLLAISTSSLPSGTIGSSYSSSMQASGGTAPYTWSIASGNLPAGLSLVPTTGAIVGTTTAVGTSTFTAAVADSASPAQTKSAVLSIVVAPVSLAVTTSALPSGTIGTSYSTLLQAGGGTAPYGWSITAGSLPAGLTLGATTGIISGTPTTTGTANFTATATDSGNPAQAKSVSLSIAIAPVTLSITSSALPSGTQGTSYSRSLQASGGTAPYTWSISSGTLPAGLTLTPATGVIAGTPTVSGNFTFGVTVSDAGSPTQTATATVSLVLVATGAPLAISTTTLPGGPPNKSYSAALNATGGTAPYTWTITSGSLPTGLSLAATTGTISGTPTTSSTTNLTFAVADSSSPVQTKSVTLSLAIAAVPLAMTTSSVPAAIKGTSYSSLLLATGGSTPYVWSITAGSLPAGLTLGSATGLISGTPTTAGTATFTATVTDAGNPTQTKSVQLSIAVTVVPLAIATSSMPAATKATSYSSLLQASGGTTPYTWSITGSLPAGLTLSATTGLISGTPTTTGTASFTATVTDAGSPAQTKAVALSIVVAAAAAPTLTISASLPSGTAGTAYSSPMTATGGTPAYTWSISSGTLPAGLTLSATTGIISGTPSTGGTSNFTATVSDNGSPVQTKSVATSIFVAAASGPTGPATTWYVRPDGGTRYSPTATAGQCDGKADVAYSGTGTNQHCAFSDYRYLYDDQSYQSHAWVIAGGDTVILRGGPWRVGVNQGATPNDVWCSGQGDPYDCTNPTIPSGTATQPTRILGENYGSCTQSNMTQLYGGFGVFTPMNLRGAQFVTIQCVELTRHSQCIKYGLPAYPSSCNTSFPLDDYATHGAVTDVNTHDVTLQDMWIHGFISRGIIGPIGGTINATRVDIAYNGAAGWDFDDGNATPNVNGVINLSGVTIEWNGCNQAYPGTGAISCYSQSTGGYGDGIGTPTGTCLTAHVDHSTFRYNMQDGYDMLHNDTGSCSMSINSSASYGNNGSQFKWGPNDSPMTFTNNTALANCNRLSTSFPGQPSTFNTNLSDFCRANDAIVIGFRDGGSLLMENNTIVSYAPTTFDTSCWGTYPNVQGQGTCNNSTFVFKNNVVVGYDNPATYNMGGQAGGPGVFYFQEPIGTFTRSNNLYYGFRPTSFSCPTGIPGEQCADPLFIGEPTGRAGNFVESELDNFNFHITPTSPAVGAGVYIPSLTLDYSGASRPNPPSLGALEP